MPIKNIPPGEWKLTIIDPNSTFETMGYFIKIGDNTTAISSCILQKDYPQAEYSQQEIEAIGKLLHAAPKLYQALEVLIDSIESGIAIPAVLHKAKEALNLATE